LGAATATHAAPRFGGGLPASHRQGAGPAANHGWLILSPALEQPPARPCRTLRAVDIETGAAFAHDGCTARAWVVRAAVDAARAAMRALLSGDLGTGRSEAGDTAYVWRWVDSSDASLIGDLRRPSAPGANAGPVSRLLRELDTVPPESCAPGLPPPAQLLVATVPGMINAVSADRSQELTVAYRRAREQWTRLRACEP
jgi:hypothetical protein